MSEIHVSVGSYVVNALDDDELTEFEAHLATCETCQREVVEFSETAAQLSSITETAPPPALRDSILSAIQQVRPLPPEGEETAPPVLARRAVPTVEDSVVEQAPVVDELAQRRQRRSTRVLALAVAAAMVIALGLGGWVVNLVQARQAIVAESTLETQLFTAPDVRTYTKTLENGSLASFVVSKSLDKALFIGRDLPKAGDNKTYQLWTSDAKGLVPNAIFDGGATTKTWFTGSVADINGMAISIEPSGGSQQPGDDVQAIVAA